MKIKVGIQLGVNNNQLESAEGFWHIVDDCERLGFDSLWLSERASGRVPDNLSAMAAIAGRTQRLKFGSSVLVVPAYNPVLLAKSLATIDVLSNGRVTLGVGVGWMREEIEALGGDFGHRGAVSDEYIAIFKKLWTESPVEHAGKYYSFGPLRAEPRPVQRPHPPIWIGGHSPAALKRTARLADGWHPVGAEPDLLEPPEFARLLDQLKRETEAAGRDFASLTIAFTGRLHHHEQPAPADRKRFTGSAAQLLEDVQAYRRLGVSELCFDFRRATIAETLEQMDRFASEVMARAG